MTKEELKDFFNTIPRFSQFEVLKEFKKDGLRIKQAGGGVLISYQCRNREKYHALVYSIKDYNDQLHKFKKIMARDLLKIDAIYF